jgi:hypothetical protein
MAHWAEIDLNNIVTRVLVVDNSIVDGNKFLSEEFGLGGTWVQTSYNTRGGIHYDANGQPDGGTQIGYNYAGVGYSWDGVGFAAPQPYPSWKLNADSYLWEAPTPMPTDGKLYSWDEATKSWTEVVANA